MKQLAITYPKSQVDEAKIDRFARIYRKSLQPKITQQIKDFAIPEFTFRERDTDAASIGL